MPIPHQLPLNVRENSILQMMDAFESGMCDPGRSNAIALALKSEFDLPVELRVCFQNGKLIASCFGETVGLPDEIGDWLLRAMEGHTVRPRTFMVEIPAPWIGERIAPDESISVTGEDSDSTAA